MNSVGFLALGSSLELLVNQGLSHQASPIADRILELRHYASDQLGRVDARLVNQQGTEHQSGIISFQLPKGDHQAVRDSCLANGVVLSCRGGCLRLSPHAYNQEHEIDQLVETIRDSA